MADVDRLRIIRRESRKQTLNDQRTLTPSTIEGNRRFDRMNVAVLVTQCGAWLACLILLPVVDLLVLQVLIVVFFCFMMQGVFSMMHESFHAHAHRHPGVNYAIGWLASTLFGASATLIGINHLGHHVRNRTRAELVDYVEPDESQLKKTMTYYLAIFGGIWLGGCLGSLLLAVTPMRWIRRLQLNVEVNTYAAAFDDFRQEDFKRIRWEVLGAIVFWVTIWQVFQLDWRSVLILYLSFAVSWSSLQWIYHVRTPLDVVEGTYNVRAPWWVRRLFLNFNYNLTHHRDPSMRWQRMHAATDLTETRPFWYVWFSILKPPIPLPEPSSLTKTYF